jgi:hypothetical protein
VPRTLRIRQPTTADDQIDGLPRQDFFNRFLPVRPLVATVPQ